MQKTLIVTNNFPPVVGGVSQVAAMISKSLPEDRVVVVAPSWEGDAEFDRTLAFPVRRVRCRDRGKEQLRGPIGKMATVFHVINLTIQSVLAYRKHRCELVFFPKVWPIAITGLVFHLFGVPYIGYAHGSDIIMRRSPVVSWFRRKFLLNAAGMLANSRFTQSYVLRYGVPENRTAVIHPRIDPAPFEEPMDVKAFKKQEGLDGKQVLFVVARLYPNKGIQRIIPLLPELVKEFPNLMYVVAGTGPYEKDLKELAEAHGVADRVVFPGNRDIRAFFRACDVYIMTTLWNEKKTYLESFGIAFLEASACGKPSISGTCGGMPESVEHGVSGLNVDPDDPEALKAAIRSLLADPEYARKLGEQGRERVKQQFTYDKMGEEFKAFVNGLGL